MNNAFMVIPLDGVSTCTRSRGLRLQATSGVPAHWKQRAPGACRVQAGEAHGPTISHNYQFFLPLLTVTSPVPVASAWQFRQLPWCSVTNSLELSLA